MNAKQAREICIKDYLSSEGIEPVRVRQNGRELWYLSPLRDIEKTPSFKVDAIINKWFDHGLGEGGNTLDLICRLREITVREALGYLDSYGFSKKLSNYFSSSPQLSIKLNQNKKESKFELVRVKEISHKVLLAYLEERCIPLSLAKIYLREVSFKSDSRDKSFFALGWKTGNFSYELRSKVFKGFIGDNKKISSLNVRKGSPLLVFEGFFDFLSFLVLKNIEKTQSTVLVLNSVALKSEALNFIKSGEFSETHLFLDNDEAGRDVTEFFKKSLKNNKIVDHSSLYKGKKDLNELLCKSERISKTS